MFPSKYPWVWKPRKHIKSKGKLFSKAELIWGTARWNRKPGSTGPTQGMEPVVGQPPASTLQLPASLLKTAWLINGALRCPYGRDWESHCSALPILKTWLHSSFATICSECLHSLFLFLRASRAKRPGWWQAYIHRALSVCPTGKDNRETDDHMPAQKVNYRLGIGGPFRMPEFSFHRVWEFWLQLTG